MPLPIESEVPRQLGRFALVGAVGFLVDAALLLLAIELSLGRYLGRVISFLGAVWVTWQLNRRYTFSPDKKLSVWREWSRYLIAMSGGGLINLGIYAAVVALFGGPRWIPVAGVAAGSIAGMVANFLAARHWVFLRRQP